MGGGVVESSTDGCGRGYAALRIIVAGVILLVTIVKIAFELFKGWACEVSDQAAIGKDHGVLDFLDNGGFKGSGASVGQTINSGRQGRVAGRKNLGSRVKIGCMTGEILSSVGAFSAAAGVGPVSLGFLALGMVVNSAQTFND